MCLENLIGIRNQCGEPTSPDSVFWINDLPNISLAEVDAAIDKEYKSAIDMIQKKIALAGTLITSQMRTFFQPRFKGASVIENGLTGHFLDDKQVVTAEPTYLIGKTFTINEGYPYFELSISRIGLHVNFTGPVDVFVYDMISDKLLDTFPVSTIAGQVSYSQISKTYNSYGQRMNLFIGYLSSFDSYKTNLTRGGCNSCNGYTYSNQYVSISQRKILSASAKLNQNLETSTGDGLSITYSVNCSFDEFVCQNKLLIAEPQWYKTGELLIAEMKYTKRLNSYITIYGANHTELMEGYRMASEKSLANVLQNMKITDNACFVCNKKARLEVALP